MIPDSASRLPDEGQPQTVPYPPPFHAFEKARLDSLRRYEGLAHPGDRLMVSVACEATEVCAAPVGMVSLMEAQEERFLACVGMGVERADRSVSICAHAILEADALVVDDLAKDPRFRHLPGVVGPPFLRFYAGAPILDGTGLPLGAVCVTHTRPHQVSSKCLLALRRLADVASAVLEVRLLQARPLARDAPRAVRDARQTRLDDLLLTILEPRPSCG